VLKSPTSLLPILDLKPVIEFTFHRSRQTYVQPIPLTSGQLAARETMVSVPSPVWPCFEGASEVRWGVAGQTLASKALRTISARAFQDSLYVLDSRYVFCDHAGNTGYSRYFVHQDGVTRLGPCFVIASREKGIAAVHPLQVRIQYKDPDALPAFLEQEVLITDGPSLFIPTTTTPEKMQQFSAFELYNKGEYLGLLSLCSRDVATFTSEGGFIAPEDSPWTSVAEEELADHLRRLMEVPSPFESGS